MTFGNCHTTLIRAAPVDGTVSLSGTRKCLRLLPKALIDLSQYQKSRPDAEAYIGSHAPVGRRMRPADTGSVRA
jgi:hypothetical protein